MGKYIAERKVSAMGLDAGTKTGFVTKSFDTKLLLFTSKSLTATDSKARSRDIGHE
jgi:hypothetical protein